MKKVISLLMMLVMLITMVSCNANKSDYEDEEPFVRPDENDDFWSDYHEDEKEEEDDSDIEEEYEEIVEDAQEVIENIDIGISVDKEEHVHSYSSATCTSPKKCSCGQTSGKALGHNYSGAECTRCGFANPDYEEPSNEPAKTYGFNETWKVDGKFEFKITSVTKHLMCNDNYDKIKANGAVIINYEVKNIGFSPKLEVTESDFDIYDQNGQNGDVVYFDHYCDHDNDDDLTILQGGTAKSSIAGAVITESNKVTVIMEIEGYTATFSGNTTEAPIEEETEEDKLQGTTINVENSLPATFSYYSGQTKQSSCRITDVSFEVSGDDLYIYFTGRKTYDSRGTGQSDSCKISWKLYDDTNTVIAAGTAYTLSIAMDEGFSKTEDRAYDCITPGNTYTLKLLDTN